MKLTVLTQINKLFSIFCFFILTLSSLSGNAASYTFSQGGFTGGGFVEGSFEGVDYTNFSGTDEPDGVIDVCFDHCPGIFEVTSFEIIFTNFTDFQNPSFGQSGIEYLTLSYDIGSNQLHISIFDRFNTLPFSYSSGGSLKVIEFDESGPYTKTSSTGERLIAIPDTPIPTPLPGSFVFFFAGIVFWGIFLRKTCLRNAMISV